MEGFTQEKIFTISALLLSGLGALILGLSGLFNVNLIACLAEENSITSNIIYLLFGGGGLYFLIFIVHEFFASLEKTRK